MKKLLRPGDVLLLGLGGLLDIFEDLRDPFGLMSTGCKQLYGWVPEKYKKHNFYKLAWRRLKTGEIERVIKKGQPYLRLTSSGKEKIKRDFPLLAMQRKRWDRKWHLALYDIAEISRPKRDILRSKLRELKFGMFQRSVWITPFDFAKDFREFVEANKLGDCVYILEAPAFLAGDPKKLAAQVWGLDKLNRSYEKIYEKAQDLYRTSIITHDREEKGKSKGDSKKRKKKSGGLNDLRPGELELKVDESRLKPEESKLKLGESKRELVKRLRKIKSQYLSDFLADPHLPKELLPEDWYEEKAREEIRKVDKLFRKLVESGRK